MKRHLLVMPVLLLLVASAAGQPDIITTRFKQLDTNGDGKISAEDSRSHGRSRQELWSRRPGGSTTATKIQPTRTRKRPSAGARRLRMK